MLQKYVGTCLRSEKVFISRSSIFCRSAQHHALDANEKVTQLRKKKELS